MNLYLQRLHTLIVAPALAAGLGLACALSPLATPTATPLPPPTGTAVEQAPAASLAPTEVPSTATLAPTSTPTAEPVNIPATRTAEAQAETLAAIGPDLERYGFSADQGSLGWAGGEPAAVELEEYQEVQVVLDYPFLSVTDFVVQADVTWNSTSGLAGCGFLVRLDRFTDSQFQFLTLRLSGAPVWVLWVYEDGVFSFDAAGYRESPALDVSQGSTNRIALVGQGNRFTAYINGEDAGSATHRGPREGAVGLLAKHESGKTTCVFENAWMWILET